MLENTKKKLSCIESFYNESKNLEEIISKELTEIGKNSIDCLSTGRLLYDFGDIKTNHVVYLRVGFKSEKSLDCRDKNNKVLCAVGFSDVDYSSEEGKYKFKRIITPFKKLPIFVQAAIFQTAFGGFKYPINYVDCYEEFLKTCSNFDKLEPCFKECFFLDKYLGGTDVTLHTIKFDGWDEIGRYRFIFDAIEGGGLRTATLDEDDMYRISHNGIAQWGFDYAMSTNKEELISCLTDKGKKKLKDYTEK